MVRSVAEFRDQFRAARRAGTPLILVRTADPASATCQLSEMLAPSKGKPGAAIVRWDLMNGLVGTNPAGKQAVEQVFGERAGSLGPAEGLVAIQKLPADSVTLFHNAQRFWDSPDVMQAAWNLRDVFKRDGQMLVLLGTPGAALPVELQAHVVVFDEPLPSPADLRQLVTETFHSAQLAEPDEASQTRAVDALIGLAAFPAEQVLAMSLSKSGLDFDLLWQRKCQAVEQTPGLSIWTGKETFAEIGGCEAVKTATANYSSC